MSAQHEAPGRRLGGRVARRWLWALAALPLLAGLLRLRFDADIFNLMPAGLPAVRGLQLQQRNFADARELLVTLQSPDPEAATAAASAISSKLVAEPALVRAARWQAPWLEHPEDGIENLAWLWLQQPPSALARLAARLSAGQLAANLAAVRETLATSLDPQQVARRMYDPLGFTDLPVAAGSGAGLDAGAGIFSNGDGTYRVVFVEPANDRMNYRAAAAWVAAVHRSVETTMAGLPRPHSAVSVAYTGGPAFLAEISTGMEGDLQSSVLTTVVVIAGLFWCAHRGWRPLGWLVAALALTLGITLALGGLLFGTLNVVSLGFAAVLLGLAVDYGLVSYQEFAANPEMPPHEIRAEVAPGILYSAATTAGTFLLLGLAGLPGLAQLGVLTAVGLLIGAGVMLFVFLPLVARRPPSRPPPAPHRESLRGPANWLPTIGVAAFVLCALLGRGLPGLTRSSEPLRPRKSAAYDAMDQLKLEFGRTNEPLWLVFAGADPEAVGRRMDDAQLALAAAVERGEVASFNLPAGFWPRSGYALQNRTAAAALARRRVEVRAAAESAGFTADSTVLADGVLRCWGGGASSPAPGPWPANPTAQWLVSQFAAREADGRWLALGIVQPDPRFTGDVRALGLPPGVFATSWETLGASLLEHVARRVAWLTSLIAAMLLGSLWLAFRTWREVALSLAALLLSFALLLAIMALLGWSWNLLSLIALPLLLGSSVDSTIHVQLALRRHGSDLKALWRVTGKALLLCAGANIAGFGSLAFTNNAGLASLDLVCAVGVACVFGVCFWLLPLWWRVFVERPRPDLRRPPGVSWVRGAAVWRGARGLARLAPRPLLAALAGGASVVYRWARPAHFSVTVENMLPVCGGDLALAKRTARENFRRFASKLVDLWRYEAGALLVGAVQPGDGWQHFSAARRSGRGLLLVTPHLGNWEFGAPLLAEQGIRLLVLTAPEPETRLTELRAAARARLGVDTLVVGRDPFAFVDVIKRLQGGGAVALLLDRPTPATAVGVEFFGRAFSATIAAADLARASGCIVLPVFIVEDRGGYQANTLAPVEYDPRDLGDRRARAVFTGRLMRLFEPAVRRYASQWFHFVPIWPKEVRS